MMDLTIPYEVADGIVVAALADQIAYIESDQKKLTQLYEDGTIAPYQERDFSDNTKILFHLKATYKYFAGVDYVQDEFRSNSFHFEE